VNIYLVRHAKAGERNGWDDDDRLRPLSGRGHLQARELITVLDDAQFDRVLSSPYVRCMETVVPIAGVRGLAIEPAETLAEGATLDEVLSLVGKHAQHGAIFCTHGDVIPMLLDHYAGRDVDIGVTPQWPKGCTWVLETDATGEVRTAQYLPPPTG